MRSTELANWTLSKEVRWIRFVWSLKDNVQQDDWDFTPVGS
jgi:hypothetical protein